MEVFSLPNLACLLRGSTSTFTVLRDFSQIVFYRTINRAGFNFHFLGELLFGLRIMLFIKYRLMDYLELIPQQRHWNRKHIGAPLAVLFLANCPE